jgi:hypothetical protein
MLAANTTALAVQQFDLEMYKVEAKGGTSGATFDAGDSVGIQCSWSIRKLVPNASWPTEQWRGVISVDGKTIRETAIPIDSNFVNKVSKAFGWTWMATGAGPRTVGCALVNTTFKQDNDMGNNKASTTIHVNAAPLNFKSALPAIVKATPVQPQAPQLPDLTSAAQLTVAGKHTVAWGGAVTLTDADARAANDGVCQVAFEHEMRNAGGAASGGFSRRWNNEGQAAGPASTAPAIAAGGAVKRVDTLSLKPGVNKLVLGLDNLNQVQESNENNNVVALTVTINGNCGGGAPRAEARGSGLGGSRFAPVQGARDSTGAPPNPRRQGSPLKQQPGSPDSPQKGQGTSSTQIKGGSSGTGPIKGQVPANPIKQ